MCMFNLFSITDSPLKMLAEILAYVIVIIMSLSLHEFAHAYSAYKFGDNTPKAYGRLTLNPFAHIDPFGILCLLLVGFGWAKPVEVNPLKFRNYKVGMSVVSLAGVITNFLLAFVFSGLFFFCMPFMFSSNLFLIFLGYIFEFGAVINIGLCIFNLLPIYPLDGFKFLQTFLSYENKFVRFMQKYGSILLLVFIITPLFDDLFTMLTGGIMSGFFVFWSLFI